MADVVGIIALLVVGLVTVMAARRWPGVAVILLCALAVRVLAVLFQAYIGNLPDSTADAVSFERTAWEWGQNGFLVALGHYTGPHSYFHSWLISLLYALFGRSPVMAQSLSLAAGMGTVLLGYLLARSLWGELAARKAGWVLAFFPTLVLYSALTLREAFIWFFLLVALFGVVGWARYGGVKSIALGLFGFAGATFFHGAMLVGALAFLGLIGWRAARRLVAAMLRNRMHPVSLGLVLVSAVFLASYVAGAFSVPKLGTFDRAVDVGGLMTRIERSTRSAQGDAGAAFPAWTVPQQPVELFVKVPVRALYFTVGPFPWDVRSARHLIGFFDGLLYLALVVLILRNFRTIWRDPAARAVLLVLVGYLIVFGMVVGNFGTGIRHRAKFVAGLVILAAPLLPRLKLLRKRRTAPPPALPQADGR